MYICIINYRYTYVEYTYHTEYIFLNDMLIYV